MSTVTTPVRIRIEPERASESLRRIREEVVAANGEVALDLSLLARIDSSALREMELLARAAEEKNAKPAVHGANIEIYKVLKLARLSERFRFVD